MNEPFDFRDAVTGLDLTVYFSKRQECFSGVEQFQSPNWALDFGHASVPTRTRGVVLNEWASFCMAMGPGTAVWNGQQAPPGTLALLPPGGEADGSTVESFNWLTAAVPPDIWRRCLMLAGADDTAPRELTVFRLPPALFATLRNRMVKTRMLLGEAPSPDCMRPLACRTENLIMDAFTTACELAAGRQPLPCSLRNRARLARRAEEWMIEHLGEHQRMSDICIALGVSRRELEYAFRSIFNQSPRDFLDKLRLHAIRRVLLVSEGSDRRIIDIAYANGISHLGRFAANYRALFGENPVETIRRLNPRRSAEPTPISTQPVRK